MTYQLRELYERRREAVLYLFFGALTTFVNIAVFMAISWMGIGTAASNGLAWVISVFFAYGTNRKWVFQSRADSPMAIAREIGAFFGARAFTGLLDMGIVVLFVDSFTFPGLPVKILSNVLVIVLNYIFSKVFIFRTKTEK